MSLCDICVRDVSTGVACGDCSDYAHEELMLTHGKLNRIAALIVVEGCNCACDHHHEEHDDDCERCLACLINAVLCESGR